MLEITMDLARDICVNLGVPDAVIDILLNRMFGSAGGLIRPSFQYPQVSNRDQAVAVVIKSLDVPLWR